jgi:transposase
MSKKTYQRYSAEFKEQVLGLVALGKPVAEVAQEFQVSSNLIYEWRCRLQRSQGGSAGLPAPQGGQSEADVLRALRRENARLQAENEILKKAAVILGSKPHLNGAK